MDNPQELKKLLLSALAEKGDYQTLLENIGDDEEKKNAILGLLVDKGEYKTVLNALNDDEKKKETEEVFSKIAPIFQLSEMLTGNTKQSLMGDLQAELDEKTKVGLEKFADDIAVLKEDLRQITNTLLQSTKTELVAEHLARYKDAETALGNKMLSLTVQVAGEKAQEMFAALSKEAKLTEDEIEDIIEAAALSVESQIASIIGEYIRETKVTPDQIVGFAEAVKKILPPERQVTWNEIVGKPQISQGGTSAVLVKRMIDDALASFSAGSGHTIQDEGTPLTQRTNLNFVGAGVTVTDDAANDRTVVTIPGGGGGGGFTELAATGDVDGVNRVFTFPSEVDYIVVDGVWHRQTTKNSVANWTNVGLTYTLNTLIVPSYDIFGIAN